MKLSWMEHLVFEMEKDKQIFTAKHFKAKYINFNIRHSEVYKAIVNYRIQKYGNSFNTREDYSYHSKEECLEMCEKARKRRYNRRKRK